MRLLENLVECGRIKLMQISDWVAIVTTLVLASTAFVAPYIIEMWKHWFYSPKLTFKFLHCPPDCHQTQMRGPGVSFLTYYFRFRVANVGKTQAEQCEAVLEKIWRENSAGVPKEISGFSPVS